MVVNKRVELELRIFYWKRIVEPPWKIEIRFALIECSYDPEHFGARAGVN